jgi:uncharacterized protein YdhG (YjbR/CyaY superfamily)
MARGIASVDDYLAAQPPPARAVLARVRAAILEALPGATEGISYRIPIYEVGGAMAVYFAGFQRHWSIYPATPRVLDALADELADRVHGKATIRFSWDEPVPVRLVARIAQLRAAEVTETRKAKAPSPSRAPPSRARPGSASPSRSSSAGRPGSRGRRGSRRAS